MNDLRTKMNDRARGGMLPWFLGAVAVALAVVIVSMAVRVPADVAAAPLFRPPPSTAGTDLEGTQVALGSMQGAPLVVIFFASWCGPCHEDAPMFTDLAGRYGERVGFVSVAVDDVPEAARAFATRYGWTWPVLRDGERRWVAAFGPAGVPATFVVDGEGAVIRTLSGPVTEEQVHAALDPLVSPSDTVDPTG
jgi:cytochrome c biogenesis protein CcmG, thiol:disulfide interchange protein DsbE